MRERKLRFRSRWGQPETWSSFVFFAVSPGESVDLRSRFSRKRHSSLFANFCFLVSLDLLQPKPWLSEDISKVGQVCTMACEELQGYLAGTRFDKKSLQKHLCCESRGCVEGRLASPFSFPGTVAQRIYLVKGSWEAVPPKHVFSPSGVVTCS